MLNKIVIQQDPSNMTPEKKAEMILQVPKILETLQVSHGFNPKDKGTRLQVMSRDAFSVISTKVHLTHDAIRTKLFYSKGVHAWAIIYPIKESYDFAGVGVGTVEANLSTTLDTAVIGFDQNSWGWDMVKKSTSHNFVNSQIHTQNYPKDGLSILPNSTIYMILDCDEGILSFKTKERFLGVAHSGLKGKKLYPMLSMAKEGTARMEYQCGMDTSRLLRNYTRSNGQIVMEKKNIAETHRNQKLHELKIEQTRRRSTRLLFKEIKQENMEQLSEKDKQIVKNHKGIMYPEWIHCGDYSDTFIEEKDDLGNEDIHENSDNSDIDDLESSDSISDVVHFVRETSIGTHLVSSIVDEIIENIMSENHVDSEIKPDIIDDGNSDNSDIDCLYVVNFIREMRIGTHLVSSIVDEIIENIMSENDLDSEIKPDIIDDFNNKENFVPIHQEATVICCKNSEYEQAMKILIDKMIDDSDKRLKESEDRHAHEIVTDLMNSIVHEIIEVILYEKPDIIEETEIIENNKAMCVPIHKEFSNEMKILIDTMIDYDDCLEIKPDIIEYLNSKEMFVPIHQEPRVIKKTDYSQIEGDIDQKGGKILPITNQNTGIYPDIKEDLKWNLQIQKAGTEFKKNLEHQTQLIYPDLTESFKDVAKLNVEIKNTKKTKKNTKKQISNIVKKLKVVILPGNFFLKSIYNK